MKRRAMKQQPEFGSFTDPRDGRKYRTVKIGRQTWLAENLNFDCPESRCYNNDPKNAEIHGRLYDWETAKKAVPPGWHLPSDGEWQDLLDFAGDGDDVGKKLKAASGWDKGGNGTDDFGFAALPSGDYFKDEIGFRRDESGFYNIGEFCTFWTASTYKGDVWTRGMSWKEDKASRETYPKNNMHSVRCVKG